jgi:hypothetical protein
MFPGQPETHIVEQDSRSHSAVDSRYGSPVDWTLLVADIKAGDPAAMGKFTASFQEVYAFIFAGSSVHRSWTIRCMTLS